MKDESSWFILHPSSFILWRCWRAAMTEERRARMWALFNQAADLPAAQQQALLEAACPDDLSLRSDVEQLLAGDARLLAEGEPTFLQSPVIRSPQEANPTPAAAVPEGAAAPALPDRIGR